jgi:putative addiction module antidote
MGYASSRTQCIANASPLSQQESAQSMGLEGVCDLLWVCGDRTLNLSMGTTAIAVRSDCTLLYMTYTKNTMSNNVILSTATLTAVENSVGIVLPDEVLAVLQVTKGDTLYLTETPDGVLLSSQSPEFTEVMAAAEIVMREDHDVLKILAK